MDRVRQVWCIGWLATLAVVAACGGSPEEDLAEQRRTWRTEFEALGGNHVDEGTDEMIDDNNSYYCADDAVDHTEYIDHVATVDYLPRNSFVDSSSKAGTSALGASAEATDCDGLIDRDELSKMLVESLREGSG